MIGATRYGTGITGSKTGLCMRLHGCCRVRVGMAHVDVPRVRTAFRTLALRTYDRLDCAANAKRYIFATSGAPVEFML